MVNKMFCFGYKELYLSKIKKIYFRDGTKTKTFKEPEHCAVQSQDH